MSKMTRKITVMEKKRFIKDRLGGDAKCARKALMLIYDMGQTPCEKAHSGSILEERNGCGFDSAHSEFLSSLAEQFRSRGELSERQDEALMRIMPRYWRQIMLMVDEPNLTEAILRDRAAMEQGEASNVG